MRNFLIFVAFCAGVFGLLLTSSATGGVGLICLGCLFAIFGRIHQAAENHADLVAHIERANNPASRERPKTVGEILDERIAGTRP